MNIIESNFNFGSLDYNNKPLEIILHHAAASNCTAEDINQWHKNNGWSGIGYHYFVRKDGCIYKGRPDNCIGAHCSGHNTNTLGICFEGDFEKEVVGEIQAKAGNELIGYLKKLYGISKISYHRDYFATSCPGKNFSLTGVQDNSQSSNTTATDNWVARLQEECNNQGFSKQIIDGIPGPNTINGCPVIKFGAQGNITRLIQEKLGVSPDGIFGEQTKAAVMEFQKKNGLVVDGIIGVNTWRKLLGL